MIVKNFAQLISLILFVIMLSLVNAKPYMQFDPLNDLKIIRACNETSPVERGLLNRILVDKSMVPEESRRFNCFLYCLYEKYGLMDTEGTFDTEYIIKILSETPLSRNMIEIMAYKCSALDSIDRCDRALEFTQCFWKESMTERSEERIQAENYLYRIN